MNQANILRDLINLMAKQEIKVARLPGGRVRLRGLSRLPADQAAEIVEQARQLRAELTEAINNGPALCEVCPAAGTWPGSAHDAAGLLCFYWPFYEGKPGQPIPCDQARQNCPLVSVIKSGPTDGSFPGKKDTGVTPPQ